MATCEKLENNKAKLTISIPADKFAEATQKAYIKNVKHFNVPGFRKGKAPRKVIEGLYGPQVFFEDAFEMIWGDAYDEAVKEHDLIPVDQPELSIETISLEEGVSFTAEVQLQPEVKLGAYRGLEVEEPNFSVEDAAVDAQIEQEREKNARFIDVDRPAENGDRVVIDYAGTVDGVAFDGGTAEEQTLVLGSHSFIDGFEEQVVGMKAGEEKDLQVKFPDNYTKELAGKDAVFHVVLRTVQIKELPELDDEFAKDISEFNTLEELKADRRHTMEERAARNKKSMLENRAVEAACKNAEVDIPEVMIKRQANQMVQELAYDLQMNGMSLDDYMKYTGSDIDKVRDQYHDGAKERVKMQLVIDAIRKAENMDCTAEEVETYINEYAERIGMKPEDLRKNLSDDDREFLHDRAVAEKVVNLLVDSAVLVPEKKKEEAEPQEKAAEKE